MCKSRNDISGQTIKIEWHVCLGGTSVQILHKLQESMSQTGHAPDNFADKIIFSSMFKDIIDYGSKKVQGSVWTVGKKWPLIQPDSDLVIGFSVVQDRNRPGNTTSQDLLLMLVSGSGATSLL